MSRCVVGGGRAPFIALFFGFGTLSACVKAPELHPIANSSTPDQVKSPGSISINEVVKRVKCEIRDAIADRVGKNYDWFSTWTITADLSLSVNDNSQISPGLVLTHPFLAGTIPQRVSNFPQSSSLGLGGQASTTATRTEIVSFSMSVKEIRSEFFDKSGRISSAATDGYNGCLPYGSIPMDLTGNLGLKEWVDFALGPVTDQVGPPPGRPLLEKGFHKPAKAPGGGGAPAASKVGAPATNAVPFRTFQQQLLEQMRPEAFTPPLRDDPARLPKELEADVDAIIAQLTKLQEEKSHISENETTVKTIENKKQAGESLSKADNEALQKAQQELSRIVDLQKAALTAITAVLPKLQAACKCTSEKDAQPTIQDHWMGSTLAVLRADKGRLLAAIPKPPAPKYDPPIDAISHQVQFLIVLNASANPTWTMLNFKGPSPSSGSFASATDTNTHTLTLVMSEPNSPAATNARSSLTFGAAVSNQLVPQLPPASVPIF